jgi:hypothetical protein
MVANATTWLGTRNQIIAQMGHHLGVVPFGDSFTGEQFEAVLFELNAIIKNLELNNLFLWNYTEEVTPMVIGQAIYTFVGNNAIGVDNAYYIDVNGNKVFIPVKSREQWDGITNQTVAGTPSAIFFNRGNGTTPTFQLYPVPNAQALATFPSLHVRTARKLNDFDHAGDISGFPPWLTLPLTWKLTANCSHMFRNNLQERQMFEAKADRLMTEAFADNFKEDSHFNNMSFFSD